MTKDWFKEHHFEDYHLIEAVDPGNNEQVSYAAWNKEVADKIESELRALGFTNIDRSITWRYLAPIKPELPAEVVTPIDAMIWDDEQSPALDEETMFRARERVWSAVRNDPVIMERLKKVLKDSRYPWRT
jgi:hypothetical protein